MSKVNFSDLSATHVVFCEPDEHGRDVMRRVTIQDAIAATRPKMPPTATDDECLDTYMVIHWGFLE